LSSKAPHRLTANVTTEPRACDHASCTCNHPHRPDSLFPESKDHARCVPKAVLNVAHLRGELFRRSIPRAAGYLHDARGGAGASFEKRSAGSKRRRGLLGIDVVGDAAGRATTPAPHLHIKSPSGHDGRCALVLWLRSTPFSSTPRSLSTSRLPTLQATRLGRRGQSNRLHERQRFRP
jgi:hypothetical protein